MIENLDLHLEQLVSSLPPVPPVNGQFTDPRQIAKILRDLYDEDWQYLGTRHIGGNGDTPMLGCGDELRPLYQDSLGQWYLAHKDSRHYGDPDKVGTKMLLKFAQDNKL
jgi:hypothetical protein